MISKCTIPLIYSILLFLFIPCNLSGQWVQTNGISNIPVFALAVSGNNVYAGSLNNGVYISSNGGMDWTQSNSGLPAGTSVRTFLTSGDHIYAGTSSRGVYISTDNGNNWSQSNSGLPANPSIMSLVLSGNNLFVAVPGSGVYLSTNNGANWISSSNGLTTTDIRNLVFTSNNLVAATGVGVFISLDNGSNWSSVNSGLTNTDVWSLTALGNYVFAGTHTGGVFCSGNNCSSWYQVNSGLPDSSIVQSLVSSGINLFAGLYKAGVFFSENIDTTWTNINNGLSNNDVRCLAISSTYLYAGTYLGGVWRRPLSEIITSVNEEESSLPSFCSLEQNYPNPFNPTTMIEYSLSKDSHVIISVFDLLGRKVKTLVNEMKHAGKHSIQLKANDMISGTYIYRLSAGNFVTTKKLLVLK